MRSLTVEKFPSNLIGKSHFRQSFNSIIYNLINSEKSFSQFHNFHCFSFLVLNIHSSTFPLFPKHQFSFLFNERAFN